MKNSNLHKAKAEKNDEFYTQISDIEREINAYVEYDENIFRGKTVLLPCDDPEWSNFTRFFATKFEELGIKKLISTSYAPESKNYVGLFSCIDNDTDEFDEEKSKRCGKIFVLEKDNNGDGRINYNDLEWKYLEGNGDFASEEVTKLRDEADFIITNPPFSKFREFLAWIMDAPEKKQFAIIGSMNAITYKEVFQYIMANELWLGYAGIDHNMKFYGPDNTISNVAVAWFTNIEHGKRHNTIPLMTMKDNVRFNKKMKKSNYRKYDNYDAIEIPAISAIPSDYVGEMGVPITFLEKYCPEQFEIVGSFNNSMFETKQQDGYVLSKDTEIIDSAGKSKTFNGPVIDKKALYKRIVIRHKNPQI